MVFFVSEAHTQTKRDNKEQIKEREVEKKHGIGESIKVMRSTKSQRVETVEWQ